MSALQIAYLDPTKLRPYKGNARTHSPKQIQQIAQSMRRFGFTNPILIDGDGGIVAGHGWVAAAIHLGIARVPTVRLEHLTPVQKRAYILADNKLAENAGWDRDLLQIELQDLLVLEADFELTDLGFEIAEVDLILAGEADGRPTPDARDDPVPLHAIPKIARLGDLWLLGEHQLFCGDALDPHSYQALLGRERASMVFTDPPYNVAINGHVSGNGKMAHSEFIMASGEMSSEQFATFLRTGFERMITASKDGAIHFVCMDWRHLGELLQAGAATYTELKCLCVWVKANGGMGSLYRSQHELVAVFKAGRNKHINNVELGRHGRNRTNVWSYPGMNSFHAGRDDALQLHPTIKPTALVADAIYDCSKRRDIILDPFCGSGTTLLAAEETGRRARCMELDPRYVDAALHRFRTVTGIVPVHATTGAEALGSCAPRAERPSREACRERSR